MYATVAQANAYVTAYYSSTDPLRVAWESLQEADKQVMLNRAEQLIDLLPLQGKPLSPGKAFPREPNAEYSTEKARSATIELAVQNLDEAASEREQMQQQGVKSYKIGDLSEDFGSGGSNNMAYLGYGSRTFSIIFPFLQEWLGGGYRICPTRTRR